MESKQDRIFSDPRKNSLFPKAFMRSPVALLKYRFHKHKDTPSLKPEKNLWKNEEVLYGFTEEHMKLGKAWPAQEFI
jgi:hypothetical protein